MRNTSLEEELRSGKTCVSTTVGDSMEPMLRNRRDTIIIEPVHGRLKRYDLPLYRRPDGKYVLASYPACEKGRIYHLWGQSLVERECAGGVDTWCRDRILSW